MKKKGWRVDLSGQKVWPTYRYQLNNRQTSKRFTFNGKSQTLPNWCRELGLDYRNTLQRIHKLKWPIERALSV